MMENLGKAGCMLDSLREDIERTENRIEEDLRALADRFSVESLSQALADKGRQLFAENLGPSISGLGDTMRETLNKVVDAVGRDPMPVVMMGAGAGLILLSLYSGRKKWGGGREEDLETTTSPHDTEEETADYGRPRPKAGAFNSVVLGLSVLALGAAMSGVIPGINAEKVEELKTDLLTKAMETGEDFIKGAEKLLRDKLSP